MNILHIESSPRGANSHSRQVAEELVQALKAKGAMVVSRDLNSPAIPHVSEEWVNASLYTRFTGQALTEAEEKTLALSHELIAEIKAADLIVFGVPMYNFGMPSVAKAWFDHIAVMGSTFAYGPNGPEGMLTTQKVIAFSARGGSGYGPGEPRGGVNFVDGQVKVFFGFLGVKDVEVLSIDNTAAGPDAMGSSLEHARKRIQEIVAAL